MGRYGARLPTPSYFQLMKDFAESSVQDDIVANYEAGMANVLCKMKMKKTFH